MATRTDRLRSATESNAYAQGEVDLLAEWLRDIRERQKGLEQQARQIESRLVEAQSELLEARERLLQVNAASETLRQLKAKG